MMYDPHISELIKFCNRKYPSIQSVQRKFNWTFAEASMMLDELVRRGDIPRYGYDYCPTCDGTGYVESSPFSSLCKTCKGTALVESA
jgi:hypothetical protein